MRRQPGFVSANIHRSLDGRHVTNYAQWESEAAFRSMLANAEARAHMGRASAIARVEGYLYQVVSTHEPNTVAPPEVSREQSSSLKTSERIDDAG